MQIKRFSSTMPLVAPMIVIACIASLLLRYQGIINIVAQSHLSINGKYRFLVSFSPLITSHHWHRSLSLVNPPRRLWYNNMSPQQVTSHPLFVLCSFADRCIPSSYCVFRCISPHSCLPFPSHPCLHYFSCLPCDSSLYSYHIDVFGSDSLSMIDRLRAKKKLVFLFFA
jgi:hypothetical protein